MSLSTISGLSDVPTPAAAECTQRSFGAVANSRSAGCRSRSRPPRRAIASIASSLGRGGPSPSELVGARTTCDLPARGRLPPGAGVSPSASAPSSSTWRRGRRRAAGRRQSKFTPRIERASHQLPGGDLELPGRARQLELERPVLRVVEHPLMLDHDAVRPERRLHVLRRRPDLCADRRRDAAAQPANVDARAARARRARTSRAGRRPAPRRRVRRPTVSPMARDDPDRRRRGEAGDDAPGPA